MLPRAICPQMMAGMAVIPQKNEDIPSTMLVMARPEVWGIAPNGSCAVASGRWGSWESGIHPAAPSYQTRSVGW